MITPSKQNIKEGKLALVWLMLNYTHIEQNIGNL